MQVDTKIRLELNAMSEDCVIEFEIKQNTGTSSRLVGMVKVYKPGQLDDEDENWTVVVWFGPDDGCDFVAEFTNEQVDADDFYFRDAAELLVEKALNHFVNIHMMNIANESIMIMLE